MIQKYKKRMVTYAFIDSQNLNIGVRKDIISRKNGSIAYKGWKLDFLKFRSFLHQKLQVNDAFLFIGNKPGNEALYEYLRKAGYRLVLKPTTTYKDSSGKTQVKGNVDTDLVLHAAAVHITSYDKAVFVAGDGDYLSLYDYLQGRGKLGRIVIPNKKSYSYLLNKYIGHHVYVNDHRARLEQLKRRA